MNRNEIEEKPIDMEVFLWKENWKETKYLEKKYIKYKKTAYPVVVG